MSKEVKTIFNLHKADVNFALEFFKNPKKYNNCGIFLNDSVLY